MATLTGHAYVAALRSLGLQFSLHPGWEKRGTWSKPFTPVAPTLHWDASNPGVDLRGYIGDRNLAGWYASRGVASELVLLSTWRTGHIGQGDMAIVRSLQAGRSVPWVRNQSRGDGYPYQWYWGLEMANRGAPVERWHPNLVRNGARWAAAHCLLANATPDFTISHLVSTLRKIDIPEHDTLTTGVPFHWREVIEAAYDEMNGTFTPDLTNPPKTGLFVHLTESEEREILELLRALVPHGPQRSAEYNARRGLPADDTSAELTQLVMYLYDAVGVTAGSRDDNGNWQRRTSARFDQLDTAVSGLADDIAAAGTTVGLTPEQTSRLAAAVVDGFLARLAAAGTNPTAPTAAKLG